jgi:hypothetical protein
MPGDFVAMKMEEDKKVLIILGRPFLSTAGVITDMREDTLTMRVGDKRIQFQFDKCQIPLCCDEGGGRQKCTDHFRKTIPKDNCSDY